MSVAYRRPQRRELPEKDKRQQGARSGLRALGRPGTALRKASYTQKPGGMTNSRHWAQALRTCTPNPRTPERRPSSSKGAERTKEESRKMSPGG